MTEWVGGCVGGWVCVREEERGRERGREREKQTGTETDTQKEIMMEAKSVTQTHRLQ